MDQFDPDFLDRRFSLVHKDEAGAGLLRVFEDSSARYCVIADRWQPGDSGLIVNRTRLVHDLVDLSSLDAPARRWWEELLEASPSLLSTFIAGSVLDDLPQLDLEASTRSELGADVQRRVQEYLDTYLNDWRRKQEMRADVVDVVDLTHGRPHSSAIAVDGITIVGVIDLYGTDQDDAVRSGAIPGAAVGSGAIPGAPPEPFVAHPRITVAAEARRGEALPFTAGLSDRPDPDADEQKRLSVPSPGAGETLLVIASAEGATIDEPAFAELPFDLAAEHQFVARVAPDAARVVLRASYLYRNKPVGHIVKSVPLREGAAAPAPVRPAPASQDRARLARSFASHEDVADVDLVLYVEKSRPGYLSWTAYVPATGRTHGPFPTAIDDTERFAKQLAGLRAKYGDASKGALEELAVTGQQIAALIPAEIVRHALVPALSGAEPPAILIMTDEPYIPWELARFGPPVLNGRPAAFLGGLARIGRWWTGAALSGPRSSRSIEHLSAVAATKYAAHLTFVTLPFATAEREWLSKTYPGIAIPVEAQHPDIEDWLDTEPRRRGHLGHIALHGFSDAQADAQGLILGDGNLLTPNRLAGEFYEGSTPRFEVLFLNACQVGTAGERLGRIGGFPAALLSGGATAFIGPLWEVQDKVAESVAEEFYTRVLGGGEEVGEALRQLRSSSRDSITPWAYLYYGHPRLRLTLSSGGSHAPEHPDHGFAPS